jgi:hypothetical protein
MKNGDSSELSHIFGFTDLIKLRQLKADIFLFAQKIQL